MRSRSKGQRRPGRRPVGPRSGAQRDDARHIGRLYGSIYRVVRQIPRGRVLTYGQVAELAGMPGAARVVGAAMRASVPELGLPWQRVVGKRSPDTARVNIHDPVGAAAQRALLEDEGVCFAENGAISLRQYGWLPGERPPRGAKSAAKTINLGPLR